ncbi:T9SS type A sorting domain-containing protein [Aquimarina aquimarini]|uniref:T9SS type A sorting domain-containing protein n=1 Tax=Aquimarina aquimarini TaxID=1191734 RepID=UPI00131EFD0F|nr:T9SS type A sorting domain-containing protein [Aquimarina aquimarini]
MKKIILVFIVVFISLGAYAQKYTVTVSGKIGQGESDCGENDNGLKWIKVFFHNRPPVYLFNQPNGQYINKTYSFSREFDKNNDKISHISFKTVAREYGWLLDQCPHGDRITKSTHDTNDILDTCFNKDYRGSELYESTIDGNINISIVPNIKLTFGDGTNSSSIKTACQKDPIRIDATPGFAPRDNLHNWEFYDTIDSFIPKWKPISTKAGQSSIDLKLSDLYSNGWLLNENRGLNKNIQIRLNPACNSNAITNTLTIKFLPKAPEVTKDPEIAQLACSYSSTGGAKIYFDRQIYDYETVNIDLLKKNAVDDYVAYDDNNGIRRFNEESSFFSTKYYYEWQPTSDRELIEGHYKIVVTGYARGENENAPFCQPYEYDFDIYAPPPVDFTAETIADQSCYGTDNGKVKIKIISGGAGQYEYSLDNWASATTFTGPEKEVTGLAPKEYSIQVRKKTNQCLALETNGNAKEKNVVINAATQIMHQIDLGAITHIGAPDMADGKIVITSVTGGTPFTGIMGDYYNARVLLNGSPLNSMDYTAYINGFEIDNLLAGKHIIRYMDSTSGCVSEIELPEIKAPDSITFEIDKQDPFCVGEKGWFRIKNVRGGYPPYKVTWTKNGVFYSNESSIFVPKDVYKVELTDQRSGKAVQNNVIFENMPDPVEITNIEVMSTLLCYGDKTEVIVTATGGKSGIYKYGVLDNRGWHWNNSGRFQLSGNMDEGYKFRVKDRGVSDCLSPISDAIFIDQPQEIKIRPTTVVHNSVLEGNDGQITIEVTGGIPNYQLLWKRNGTTISNAGTSISNLIAGLYTAIITDTNGCKKSRSIRITDPLSLSVSTVDVTCFNTNTGKIVLTPQGGTPPYSFSIDNQQTYISENNLSNRTIGELRAGVYTVWVKDTNGRQANPTVVTIAQPQEIVISQTILKDVTTVGGTNGGISIDVVGGVGAYSFLWSKQGDVAYTSSDKDIDNLSSGLYTVSVTDEKNCVVQKTFDVKEPLPIAVEIRVTNPILCHDDALGELKATVSGGYPIESTPSDFEYRWYKVENTVDIPLNTDITLDNLKEQNAGTYKVVVRDNQGASAQTTMTLTEPEDLKVVLTSQTNVSCYGETTGTINITVTGGPRNSTTGEYLPYVFSWTKVGDPDFTATSEDLVGIKAGIYEVVIVDDNLCTVSHPQIEIQQPDDSLKITNTVVTPLTGYQTQNGSIAIAVEGGTPPYSYTWTNLDDATYTSSSKDISELKKGTYQLSLVDHKDCSMFTLIEVNEPEELIIAIEPLTADQQIQCFREKTEVPLTTITRGGTGNYTYQWYKESDPDTILFTTPNTPTVSAGTYTVVVTDNNENTHRAIYQVSEPEEILVLETVTHLKCAGEQDGKINITVEGGVPPYTFLWSTGDTTEDINSIVAGSYTIQIKDANACIYVKTITVEQPPGLFIDGTIDRTYPSSSGVDDGSITVTIGGGTSPYFYEWKDANGIVQSTATNILTNVGVEKYSLTVTDINDCKLVIEDVDLFEPPALEVAVTPVNVVSCFGNTSSGSLTAIAKGGRPFNNSKQYSYQWYDAATHLPIGTNSFSLENIGAGNYYVSITDAVGDSATSPIYTLEQPERIAMILDTDYTNCGLGNDWTILSQVRGGTPPYSYLWNTGATTDRLENITAGTYSIQITDIRGCSKTNQITITPPNSLQITKSVSIPTCYNACDGAILLETVGGTPPYTYEWNTGSIQEDLTDICSGNYTVTITDSKGCQIIQEISVDSPKELIVDLGEDTVLCKDQTIVINATITDPNASYQWSSSNGFTTTEPSIEVSEPGSYQVMVTDSKGCLAVDSIFIDKVTDIINAQFIASTYVYAGEKFVIVDNSDPIPDTIDWIFPEVAIVSYEDDNYAEAVFETAGEYEVTLQTYLGACTAMTTKKIIVIDKEFEGEERENEKEIHSYIDYLVYPNPTNTGRFTVDVNLSKPQNINLKIYNMVDNTLLDSRKGKEKDTYTFDYDMSSLPSGMYFILLETPTASQVRKLIIE